MEKVCQTAAEAMKDVLRDGITLMAGGFGLCGVPERLIAEVQRSGITGLTVISNNCGMTGEGLWHLLDAGQIQKMVGSYIGDNKLLETKVLEETIDFELVPQGTLAERMRAGGAGIPAFFTATGAGTVIAEGKPVETFEGQEYVMERWLRADLSLVKAWKADPEGNLIFRKTARNFNPVMATAGRFTVAEVEEIVPLGELPADQIHTPGIYVDRVVQMPPTGKIEKRTERPREIAS
ncbi:MAG: CoA transferase subunit A [Sphingomonadaceae bacterium]|nr:CoA transferase subunit A [Sphingomonadaceae bacterium]MCP5390867.1 CoA transferase subunit A [Sphingomonadaceae bacterium]MCP5394623.1 CoA transferase subunit A [Sphingomonadaceae bacterium]